MVFAGSVFCGFALTLEASVGLRRSRTPEFFGSGLLLGDVVGRPGEGRQGPFTDKAGRQWSPLTTVTDFTSEFPVSNVRVSEQSSRGEQKVPPSPFAPPTPASSLALC